jgi:purine-nucleoside phosphorylase
MLEAADRAARAARELARRTGVEHHDVLVILGTGLSGTAEGLGATGSAIPLATLPFFPRYTATGHHAQGWSVPIGDKTVLVFAGRCHLYEGIEMEEVVHPLRTGIATGCSTVVLTAAVGGIRDDLVTGSIVVVSDHLNLTGSSPLVGPEFVDMVDAYAPRLRELALGTAGAPDLSLSSGVYAQVRGPQFETPAEVGMLRAMGADVVGMSMALETIAARQAGAAVLGLAVVTNAAATSEGPTDIAGVGAASARAAASVADVIRNVVMSLP